MSECILPYKWIREIAIPMFEKKARFNSMNPKIYLDMDGTLVDFVKQVNKYNFWRIDKENKVDWKKVKAMGPKFWSEMDWEDNAEDAFHKLQEMESQGLCELYILSSIDFEEGRDGKIQWIKSHTNFPLEKVIFVQEPEDKANYAAPDAILIDDRNKSLKPFENAGGYSINVNFGWGHGWETVLVKVNLLLSGLKFKNSKIIDTVEKDGIQYELTEKISEDDLQIIEIMNNKEKSLDFVLIHLPYYYLYYEEVGKYYKNLNARKIIAVIEYMDDEDDIICGTSLLKYQDLLSSAKNIDMSFHIWKAQTFEQVIYSCLSTLISKNYSSDTVTLFDLKRDYRKMNRTFIYSFYSDGKTVSELKEGLENIFKEYKPSIENLSYNKAVLTILSNKDINESEIISFNKRILDILKCPVSLFELKVKDKICKGFSCRLFFSADDDYEFYSLFG